MSVVTRRSGLLEPRNKTRTPGIAKKTMDRQTGGEQRERGSIAEPRTKKSRASKKTEEGSGALRRVFTSFLFLLPSSMSTFHLEPSQHSH